MFFLAVKIFDLSLQQIGTKPDVLKSMHPHFCYTAGLGFGCTSSTKTFHHKDSSFHQQHSLSAPVHNNTSRIFGHVDEMSKERERFDGTWWKIGWTFSPRVDYKNDQ